MRFASYRKSKNSRDAHFFARAIATLSLTCISAFVSVAYAREPKCEDLFRSPHEARRDAVVPSSAYDLESYLRAIDEALKNGDDGSQRRAIEALSTLVVPQELYLARERTEWHQKLEAPLKTLAAVLSHSQDASLRGLVIQAFLTYSKNLSSNYSIIHGEFRSLMTTFEELVLFDPTIPQQVRLAFYNAMAVYKIQAYQRPYLRPFLDDAALAKTLSDTTRENSESAERSRRALQSFWTVSDAMIAELGLDTVGSNLREYAKRNRFVDLSRDANWLRAYNAGLKVGDEVLIRLTVNKETVVTYHKYSKDRIDWLTPEERARVVYLRGKVAGIAGDASVFLSLQVGATTERLEVNSNSLSLHEIYVYRSPHTVRSLWQRIRQRGGF